MTFRRCSELLCKGSNINDYEVGYAHGLWFGPTWWERASLREKPKVFQMGFLDALGDHYSALDLGYFKDRLLVDGGILYA